MAHCQNSLEHVNIEPEPMADRPVTTLSSTDMRLLMLSHRHSKEDQIEPRKGSKKGWEKMICRLLEGHGLK